MTNSIINNDAYLRTSREFPEDMHLLARETNKSYVDIAAKVNDRTIGFYTNSRPSITGNAWYMTGSIKQQSFRQVFTFTSTTTINHGITINSLSQFTPKCYGTYVDSTNSFSCGLIYASSSATTIPGQISFYLTKTQIIFKVDGAAPALASGMIVLEWLSQP
jgi:hypothetical protein